MEEFSKRRGRPPKAIDTEVILDLAEGQGLTQREMAAELGVSVPTLRKRINEIQEKQGIILQYRELQSLQLTSMQARILEAITPEKIASASLSDLIKAFAILKKSERVIDGQPGEIKGLVGLLVQMEKEDAALALKSANPGDFEKLEDTSTKVIDLKSEDYIPNI